MQVLLLFQAAYSDGKVASGCLPKSDTTGVCTGDRAAGETCQTVEKKSVYVFYPYIINISHAIHY